MRTIVSIVGPTATGKSKVALTVAKAVIDQGLFSGVDLISADSRQVYKGIEIVSGADIPDLKKFNGKISLHGMAAIDADEQWSLADFQRFALKIIESSWEQGRLPIIVGGTGLYHYHLFNPKLSAQVGPDSKLRKKYQAAALAELQAAVEKNIPDGLQDLSPADAQNPRRLIRLLEKAAAAPQPERKIIQPDSHFWFGLRLPLATIEAKIEERVAKRLKQGAIDEVEQLLDNHQPTAAVFTATGVAELKLYLGGEISLEQAIKAWVTRERRYAKRQLTWWRKYGKAVTWFDTTQVELSKVALEINSRLAEK